jgi:hypothetical protein
VTALGLLIELGRRGVTFSLEGEGLRILDPAKTLSDGERELVRALKPQLRSLLAQRLPARRGDAACEGFEAAPGAALCERCAWGIADHLWRRAGNCAFLLGDADAKTCRRCGAPRLEHLTIGVES